MRWLSKTSLFLIFLLIPDFTPHFFTKSEFCSLVAWGSDFVDFGQRGKDGLDGEDGQKGRNSENLTIFADGSPLNLDLSGQQGFVGENGSNGEDSICSNQPVNVAHNLKGAQGGDGGDGGNGGDGGDGASLTIYATNRDYLQQISVQASGGIGGVPGQGGSGGNGCQCSQIFWSVESCSGKPGSPDYSCSTKEYQCLNGESGANGRSGRPGREGKIGNLTLINSNQPLAPDRISASVAMSELKNRGFSLSKNVWETRTGATSLFMPGSIIGDQYLELVERIDKSVVLIWNAPQAFEPFANQVATLNLQDDQSVTINLPQNLWVESSILERNNVVELFIFNIVEEKEATQLQSQGLSGLGIGVELELVDKAQRSDLISTQFRIKYSISRSSAASYRRVYDYTSKYEGEVPAQFVRYSGNRFIIDIGQLPIDPRYLEANTAVEVQLEATRSFGNNSATQKIVIRDILGSFN